jgi:hypothetical protein
MSARSVSPSIVSITTACVGGGGGGESHAAPPSATASATTQRVAFVSNLITEWCALRRRGGRASQNWWSRIAELVATQSKLR